jgi:hypothetical protein
MFLSRSQSNNPHRNDVASIHEAKALLFLFSLQFYFLHKEKITSLLRLNQNVCYQYRYCFPSHFDLETSVADPDQVRSGTLGVSQSYNYLRNLCSLTFCLLKGSLMLLGNIGQFVPTRSPTTGMGIFQC